MNKNRSVKEKETEVIKYHSHLENNPSSYIIIHVRYVPTTNHLCCKIFLYFISIALFLFIFSFILITSLFVVHFLSLVVVRKKIKVVQAGRKEKEKDLCLLP